MINKPVLAHRQSNEYLEHAVNRLNFEGKMSTKINITRHK